MFNIEEYLNLHIKAQDDVLVDLGAYILRIVGNISMTKIFHNFCKSAITQYIGQMAHFEIWCISYSASNIDRSIIQKHKDKSCRSQYFSSGYYVTDHFGLPIDMISIGNRFYLFGENFQKIVWPYFIKYFLLLRTLECNTLFVKAAVSQVGKNGIMIMGRGGGGKTSLLLELCDRGAKYITNSHAVVDEDNIATGIKSTLRVRPDPKNKKFIKNTKCYSALVDSEVNIDPYELFPQRIKCFCKIKKICLMDYKKDGESTIMRIDPMVAYQYAQQFMLALNVYRLEEDLLDFFSGNIYEFTKACDIMLNQLNTLVSSCECYYISGDMFDSKFKENVFKELCK